MLRARPAIGRAAGHSVLIWESLFLLALTAPPAVVLAMLAAGAAFHAGCAIVMGLNRFIWAFVAGYPALLCTNLAIRHGIGAPTANAITIGVVAVGLLAFAFSFRAPAPTPKGAGARVTRS